MATLYFISTESYTGKTALCAALGLEYQAEGLSLTYFKPLGTQPIEAEGLLVDEDCLFIRRVLGLRDPLELICPAILASEVDDRSFRPARPDMLPAVQEAQRKLAVGHDLLTMEGPATMADGFALGIPPATLAKTFHAMTVIVSRYRPDLSIDQILMAQSMVGDHLRGVIVNSVPPDALDVVKKEFAAYLRQRGLTLFGALPQDRLLTAITVRDVVRLLGGELLCAAEKQDELVENFTVGAMHVDNALKYFLRTPNKAVITGGDRADIQLAALHTSTKCLILTGNLYPDSIVLARAAEVGVPVILVPSDTMSTVEAVDRVLGHIRLSSPRQIERLREMVRREVDRAALGRVLGIA